MLRRPTLVPRSCRLQAWHSCRAVLPAAVGPRQASSAATSQDGDHDKQLIEEEVKAQRRLFRASTIAQSIVYCREHGRAILWRRLRGITIDCNYDFRHWRKLQKASRHVDLWSLKNVVRGDNIRRLLVPDMMLVGTTSSLLCYYNMHLACPAEEIVRTSKAGVEICFHASMLSLPLECFTLTSMALGLLITFKTQACYSRFNDARALWGRLINETRGLSSRILSRVPSGGAGDGLRRVAEARLHAVQLIRTFPITLKYHLTEDGCNPHIEVTKKMTEKELQAAKRLALRAELNGIWNCSQKEEWRIVKQILDAGNKPLHVLHELGYLNAAHFCTPAPGGLPPIISADLDKTLTDLQNVLGACERILRTPVYTPYTKFTSRFLFVWCNSLPLALFPIVGPSATVPISLAVAFFMYGIEDIGSRVEQPFDVLPLWQYCQTVDQSCLQLLRHHQALEKLVADKTDADKTDADKTDAAEGSPSTSKAAP